MKKLVEFQGVRYWLLLDEDDTDGPLAPLNHCDANGNLLEPFGVSFAHYFEGEGIWRHCQKIGECSDLKFLDINVEHVHGVLR